MTPHTLYRLAAASYAGIPFPAPRHVWTLGEIKAAMAFCHPYSLKADGERLVVEAEGQRQVWELAL